MKKQSSAGVSRQVKGTGDREIIEKAFALFGVRQLDNEAFEQFRCRLSDLCHDFSGSLEPEDMVRALLAEAAEAKRGYFHD